MDLSTELRIRGCSSCCHCLDIKHSYDSWVWSYSEPRVLCQSKIRG